MTTIEIILWIIWMFVTGLWIWSVMSENKIKEENDGSNNRKKV